MARRQSVVPVLIGLGVVAYLAKRRAGATLAADDADAGLSGYGGDHGGTDFSGYYDAIHDGRQDAYLGIVPALAAAAVPAVTNYVQNLFGGGARDAARQQRAQFFTEYAQSGSVLAAQYLYGGLNQVAGNEKPYYQQGIQQLESANVAVAQEASRRGPLWIGSDDAQAPTAQQQMVQRVLADKSPLTHAVDVVGDALTGAGGAAGRAVAGVPPAVLLGGVALLAVMLSKRGR
jgi:hypothetical protein